MKPDESLTPQEEIEVRLTALLAGELPPEEAAALEARIASDAALTALYARLRRAAELLREANAFPEPSAPSVELRLSSERRERLLAHFKTVPVPAAAVRSGRKWSWALPLTAAAVLMVILGGISLPVFSNVQPRGAAAKRLAEERMRRSEALAEASENPSLTSANSVESFPTAIPAAPQLASENGFSGGVTLGTMPTPNSTAFPLAAPAATTRLPVSGAATSHDDLAVLGASPLDWFASVSNGVPQIAINSGTPSSAAAYENQPGLALKDLSPSGVGVFPGGFDTATRGFPDSTAAPGATFTFGAASVTAPVLDNVTPGNLPQKEYQRYPGHPGTTSLGSVFSGDLGSEQLYAATSSNGTVEKPPLAFAAPAFAPEQSNAGGTAGRAIVNSEVNFAKRDQSTRGQAAAPAEVLAQLNANSGTGLSTPAAANQVTGNTRSRDNVMRSESPEMAAAAAAAPAFAPERPASKETPLIASSSAIDAPSFPDRAKAAPASGAAPKPGKRIDPRGDYGVAGSNRARASTITDTDVAWKRPLRRFNNEAPPMDAVEAARSSQVLRQKLESIIIPKVEFRDATVREAVEFLKKKSVELDASSPAGQKGANLVLKLPPEKAEATATAAAAAPDPSGNPEQARITVSLANIPLMEALKYVTGISGMKFKVEPYAVSIVPITENTDVLITKEWKVPTDLIPRTAKTSDGIADQEAAKNWLVANGLTFEGAASAIYINRSLIVRNTEDQLDLVDKIVGEGIKAHEPVVNEKAAPIPQPEILTSATPFSTFSLNVSDVSFKLAAASLEQGKMPEAASVRSEEFINAFDYRDPEPAPGAPLAFAAERARYPFAQNRDLLRFSVKTAAAGRQPGHPLNIVLLLDKSGSMERADRVKIVHEALAVLATQLQPQDKLSIVTFARTPRLWADGVAGDKAGQMIARVGDITPEGGTNLEAALDLGYTTAHRHYAVGSINRVVLFTDGAANLGDVNADALTKKVEAQRKQGIALDCFGIGWEDYNDDLLEQLTRRGDGRYGFINTPEEAAANFAAQLAGAFQVAASDVKVQVEFNPRRVTAYRQIGYAKHQLKKEEFRDNSVAAASIGAAESGNALYVVEVNPRGEGDLAMVRVRFRVPGTSDFQEHEWPVPFTGSAAPLEQASPALRLAATAGAFAEWLATSPYATEVTPDRLLRVVNGVPAVYGADPRPKKLEWMIRQAKSLSGR